jgi:senataxin
MHSEIRTFPSLYFYSNKLKDHESTNRRVIPKDYFEKRTLFLDIKDG